MNGPAHAAGRPNGRQLPAIQTKVTFGCGHSLRVNRSHTIQLRQIEALGLP